MHPQLFRVFDTSVSGYLLLIAAGFVFGTAMAALWVRRIGQNPDVVVDIGLASVVMGLIGARLLHVFADGYFWDYVHLCTAPELVGWKVTEAECLGRIEGAWDALEKVCRPRQTDCWAWAQIWGGGLTFYGGFMAAFASGVLICRRDKFPFWKGTDMVGMVLPIGLGLGRLGCLMVGCCFGSQSAQPWALVFPPHSPASEWQFREHLLASPLSESLAVHPTQIYESLGALAISAVCILYVQGRKRYDGQVFVFFLASYAAVRFGLEFVRSDDRGGVLWFSTSQWISLALLLCGTCIHFGRGLRRPRRSGSATVRL